MLDAVELPEDLTAPVYGGIVPHAGWMFSGSLACKTLSAVTLGREVSTFVLLGADHTGQVSQGEVYDSGVWKTPLGDVRIDDELAAEILSAADLLRPNPSAHDMEHSLEVQVPLIQVLAPEARIVPIAIPPAALAADIGKAIGRAVKGRAAEVAIIGSTDLSHHGGHFPAPGGRGEQGEQYARTQDQRMIGLMEKMDAEAVVVEAQQHQNACGAGAIAATIAACRALGAQEGRLLEYTNSYRIVKKMYGGNDDTTVGYASVVFV